ncbi:MAG: molybdopterin molybdotransferase MoeA [Nitrososphaeraceae archaeon]
MKPDSNISYVSVKKARSMVEQFILRNRILHSETIYVRNCYKRVLAKNIVADVDIPAFDSSHMDGYAVKAEDITYASEQAPVVLRLKRDKIKPMKAVPSNFILQRQEAFRINTGEYLPQGANTVVPVEDALATHKKNEVRIIRALPVGSFVYPRGRDIKKDHEVMKRGRILRPQDIGLLDSLYITKINVLKRPRVAIISTGSELTNKKKYVKSGKVLENHSGIISKLVEELGGIPFRMGIVPDDVTKIRNKIEKAISQSMDLILTLGGSSVGEHDLVETAIKSMGVPQIFFHGVKLDRGRVTGAAISKGRPIIIMPGPIQGAINAFIIFAYPIIKLLSGQIVGKPITLDARLTQEWNARKRFPNFSKVVYVHVRSKENGEYEADCVPGETETITTFTRSDGYIIVDEKTTCIKPGEKVKVSLLPGLSYVNGQLEI